MTENFESEGDQIEIKGKFYLVRKNVIYVKRFSPKRYWWQRLNPKGPTAQAVFKVHKEVSRDKNKPNPAE